MTVIIKSHISAKYSKTTSISIMEKLVGAKNEDDLNTVPDLKGRHVKNHNEFSRVQNKEYRAHLIS